MAGPTGATTQEFPGGRVRTGPIPPGFPHQALDRFLLGPALLDGNVREVCGSIATVAVDEGDAQAVRAEIPI